MDGSGGCHDRRCRGCRRSLAFSRVLAPRRNRGRPRFPGIASFYDGGILDFSVGAIFVAGALGLPLTLVGFSASREGSAAPAGPVLLAYRVLTGAMLLAAIVFVVRREPEGSVLFAVAVIALASVLLTGPAPVEGDADAQRERGATTVSRDGRSS